MVRRLWHFFNRLRSRRLRLQSRSGEDRAHVRRDFWITQCILGILDTQRWTPTRAISDWLDDAHALRRLHLAIRRQLAGIL